MIRTLSAAQRASLRRIVENSGSSAYALATSAELFDRAGLSAAQTTKGMFKSCGLSGSQLLSPSV